MLITSKPSLSSSIRIPRCPPPPPVGAATPLPHLQWPSGHGVAEDITTTPTGGTLFSFLLDIASWLGRCVAAAMSLNRNNVSHVLSRSLMVRLASSDWCGSVSPTDLVGFGRCCSSVDCLEV